MAQECLPSDGTSVKLVAKRYAKLACNEPEVRIKSRTLILLLGGLSFPRRMGVRFHPDFVKRYHLMGMQARWSAYEDKDFTKKLGKEFYHEDMVSREGWAMYYFDGIFKKDVAYILLEIVNPQSGNLIKTMNFEFRKSYKTSFDAKSYLTDPVLGNKIVQNGTLVELKKFRKKDDPEGKLYYRKGTTKFVRDMVRDVLVDEPQKEKVEVDAIIRTQVRYCEKPKAVFLVTPPHLIRGLDKYVFVFGEYLSGLQVVHGETVK